MTEQMMNQEQMKRLADRHGALRVWEPVNPGSLGATHPQYSARRKQENSTLVKHAVGTLLVLGALALMVNG